MEFDDEDVVPSFAYARLIELGFSDVTAVAIVFQALIQTTCLDEMTLRYYAAGLGYLLPDAPSATPPFVTGHHFKDRN